jgi:translocation and assembly module TamB
VRRRLLLAVLLLLLIGALAGGWLLGSASGLRFLLARVQEAWPEGQLRVEGVHGRLIGPIKLDVVGLQAGGRSLLLRGVAFDWHPLALLGRELDVIGLQVAEIDVGAAPVPDESGAPPFDPSSLRWEWPRIELPVALALADLQLGPVRVEGQPMVRSASAALRLGRDGRLQLDRLRVDSVEGELLLQGQLPATAPGQGLRGGLRRGGAELAIVLDASGDGASLELDVVGQPARLRLALAPPFAWQLQATLQGADLRALQADLPPALGLTLQGAGDNAKAALQLQHDGALAPLSALAAQLAWQADPRAVLIESATVQPAGGGSLALQGAVQLAGVPALTARLTAVDAALQADAADAPAPRLDAEFTLQGPFDGLRVEGGGSLRRGELQLPLQLQGQLGEQQFVLDRLQLDGAAGQLEASGAARWAPALEVDLALQLGRFDPAWLDRRLAGQLSGGAQLQVGETGGEPDARLQFAGLGGNWRGAPLAVDGDLRWRAERLSGALDLALGEGRLTVVAEPGRPLQLRADPLILQPLWPGLGGVLRGELSVAQPFSPWDLQADLRGSAIAVDDYRVDRLRIEGGLAEQADRRLQLRLDGLRTGEAAEPIDVGIALQGRPAEHAISLTASAAAWQVEAAARGSATGGQRRLQFERLQLGGGRYGDWQLEPAAPIVLAPQLALPRHCLVDGAVRACVALQGDGAARALDWDISALPLARVLALVGARETLQADGELSLRGVLQLQPRPRPRELALRLSAGELRELDAEEPVSLLAWQGGGLDARDDGAAIAGTLSLLLVDDGHLDGDLRLPWGEAPAWDQLEGALRVDITQLRALSVLAPDVQGARGALRGELRWVPGAQDNPQGAVALQAFSATLPALGVSVRSGELSLRQQDGQMQIDGFLDTGDGPLRLEGSVQRGGTTSARLRVAGEGVRLANTPRLQLLASPDLDLRWQKGRLRVRGSVDVPAAAVDLERLEAGVQSSPDVVVEDPRHPRSGVAALPIDADIAVNLGEQVKLAGFGFDGGVAGTLRIIERPGRPTRGRGSLDLRGTYQAYGQDLAIERGRLLFASSALDNPGIDLRARRVLREGEVGVEVRGSARRPRLSVWSNPALDQAEALSWLVLGRPLRSASAADGDQLGQAAAAVGGNLLAAQVGGRLGFDTFGVADSTALGGAAFTVGKYLSPRLYLSYGVALFDSGRVVTLRYLITERLDVEIEAAAESRAGINYRIERD